MLTRSLLFSLSLALGPAYLHAVDGQILINQATVNAAGGFPYVISQAGSYKLSGNLIVTDLSKDAIVIAHDFVTLDFGGFSIIGTADCSSGVCSGSNSGGGLHAGVTTLGSVSPTAPSFFNITIRNGTIQGMEFGIFLYGDSNLVADMNIRSNSRDGIDLLRPDKGGLLQRIEHCNISLNDAGILLDGGRVTSNNISSNRAWGIGIIGTAALVDQNVVLGNLDWGLVGFQETLNVAISYGGNTFRNNFRGSVVPSGQDLTLVNTGHNVCGTSLCP